MSGHSRNSSAMSVDSTDDSQTSINQSINQSNHLSVKDRMKLWQQMNGDQPTSQSTTQSRHPSISLLTKRFSSTEDTASINQSASQSTNPSPKIHKLKSPFLQLDQSINRSNNQSNKPSIDETERVAMAKAAQVAKQSFSLIDPSINQSVNQIHKTAKKTEESKECPDEELLSDINQPVDESLDHSVGSPLEALQPANQSSSQLTGQSVVELKETEESKDCDEQQVDHSIDQSSDVTAELPVSHSVEQPADEPVEQSTEQPVQQSIEQPDESDDKVDGSYVDQSADQLKDQSLNPVNDTGKLDVEKQNVEESADETIDQSKEEDQDLAADQPKDETDKQSSDQPVHRPRTPPPRPPLINISLALHSHNPSISISTNQSIDGSPALFDLDSASFTMTPSPSLSQSSAQVITQTSPRSAPPLPPRRQDSISISSATPSMTSSPSHHSIAPPPVPEHFRSRSVSSPGQSISLAGQLTNSHQPITPSAPSSPSQPITPSTSQHVVNEFPEGSHDPSRRAKIEAELISSEEVYVKSINQAINAFFQPIKAADVIPISDLNAIFINIQIIAHFHTVFLADLKRNYESSIMSQNQLAEAAAESSINNNPLMEEGDDLPENADVLVDEPTSLSAEPSRNSVSMTASQQFTPANQSIADTILKLSDFMKLYKNYLNGYPTSMKTIDKHRKNAKFQTYLRGQHKSQTSKSSAQPLDLPSYLIMPVQRIPRYEMLLRELLRYTPASHPQREPLEKSLVKIKSIATSINESKREVESLSRVIALNSILTGDLPLNLLVRKLIKESTIEQLNVHQTAPIYTVKMKEFKDVNQCNNQSTNQSLEDLFGNKLKQRNLYLFDQFLLWSNESNKLRGTIQIEQLILTPIDIRGKSLGWRFMSMQSSGQADLIWLCETEQEAESWVKEIYAQIEKYGPSSTTGHHSSKTRSQSIAISSSSQSTSQSSKVRGRDTHSKIMQSLQTLKKSSQSITQSVNSRNEVDQEDSYEASVSISQSAFAREAEEM